MKIRNEDLKEAAGMKLGIVRLGKAAGKVRKFIWLSKNFILTLVIHCPAAQVLFNNFKFKSHQAIF